MVLTPPKYVGSLIVSTHVNCPLLTSGKIKDAFSMSSFTGKAEADDNHLLK
ncbi:hypothetical protein D018_4447 [Vibrio parahaemolyticus VP2007-007]|nr:hypothetical protein D018_4447 [Vibrio parahaemolyticus VP2007-007]